MHLPAWKTTAATLALALAAWLPARATTAPTYTYVYTAGYTHTISYAEGAPSPGGCYTTSMQLVITIVMAKPLTASSSGQISPLSVGISDGLVAYKAFIKSPSNYIILTTNNEGQIVGQAMQLTSQSLARGVTSFGGKLSASVAGTQDTAYERVCKHSEAYNGPFAAKTPSPGSWSYPFPGE